MEYLKILATIKTGKNKETIYNDLKGETRGEIALSEVFEAFHIKNEELIKKILESKVIKDNGFIQMLRDSVRFSEEINKKFPRYIVSIILFGSWARGEAKKTSDYDLAVVIDDTDLRDMTRIEAKQRLFGIVNTTARRINKKFTIQAYLLTEFWEYLKKANPVIFTLLRDGVPLYDKGLFTPWKLLLKMGKITPTPEAIETFINSARLLDRQIESKLEEIVVENIYYLMLNPAQALLMLEGVNPPVYSETPGLLRKHFVSKRLMPKKYADWLDDIIKDRKRTEHEKMEISGKILDKHWTRAKQYLSFMEKLFDKIKKQKSKQMVREIEKAFEKSVKETLKGMGISTKDVYKGFREHIIRKGLVPKNYLEFLAYLKSLKKATTTGRIITEVELKKAKEEANNLFNLLTNIVEKRKIKPGKPIKFVAGRMQGELWIFKNKIFIITDLKHPEKGIFSGNLKKDGSFSTIKKSDILKLNQERKKHRGEVFLREKTLESLAEFLGKEIKIII